MTKKEKSRTLGTFWVHRAEVGNGQVLTIWKIVGVLFDYNYHNDIEINLCHASRTTTGSMAVHSTRQYDSDIIAESNSWEPIEEEDIPFILLKYVA